MEQLINEFKERLKSTGKVSEKSLGVYVRGLRKVFNFYRKYNMVKTPDELFTCISDKFVHIHSSCPFTLGRYKH